MGFRRWFHDACAAIRPHVWSVSLLVLAVLVVYGRILGHEFLSNWDDNRYVMENADIQGFGPARLKAVFTSYYVGNYAPLHLVSHMLDYALWGLWPGGYLLGNLILHAANGILLYHLFSKLVGGRAAAFFGAAFFLLHPVQVESVAWVSQRKNVLAMFFFLLAWETYICYRDAGERHRLWWYFASLLLLLLALLTKSIAVIFPFAMMAFDFCYPRSGSSVRLVDKIPYLAVSAAVAAVAILSQTPEYGVWGGGGGRAGYHGGSAITTFYSMLPVFCRYLSMIVWPSGLSAYYKPDLHSSPDQSVLLAVLLLLVVAFLIFLLYRRERCLAFWPLLFFIGLLPVAQIVPLVTMMNDRYLYFPMIGAAGLAVLGVRAMAALPWQGRLVSTGVSTLAIVALALASFLRVPVWKNATSLWQDAVTKVPGYYQAWESLGESYMLSSSPDYDAAAAAYLRALALYPDNSLSWYNLGIAYTELGEYSKADAVFTELLQRFPRNVMGWTVYGELALRQINFPEAERRYRKALSLQPEAIQIHKRIANLLIVTGRIEEARHSLLTIEKLDGGYDALNAYELAQVEAVAGNTGESIRWLEQALQRGYADYNGIMNNQKLLPVMADGRFGELISRYFSAR